MKKLLRLYFCVIFLSFSFASQSQIVVNEVVSGNTSINTDEDGSFQDWVELYNNGLSSVNLNGYGLSDDPTAPYKWTFPNITVPSGGYKLIWCSDKNRTNPALPLHTNWKISGSGEVITLTAPGNVTIDTAPSTVIPNNQSLARQPNGTGSFNVIGVVTPAAQNPNAGSGGQLDPPVFSQNSGFFTTGFTLTLTSSEPGSTILYTLDGSEPSAANLGGKTYNYKNSYPQNPGNAFGPMLFRSFQTNTYSAALNIVNRTSQPNKISMTSSTYDFSPDYFPGVNIFKGTVVRAKVIKAGFSDSPVVTRNYFVTPLGSSRYTLPVISLSIDEDKLYDYEDGIYNAGKIFDDWRTAHPSQNISGPLGNYEQKGSAFERVANFHYFVNGQPILNQDVGIRVQGNNSRVYPSKSLNIYSDGMSHKFFADEPYTNFKRVVLKNSASDFYHSMFKDALCSELAKPLHTQTEASQPAITFINGEYWGLLTVREKYDDEFFLRVYGIPKSEIELLENDGEYVEEGTNTHFMAMYDYFETHSLVPQANYDYIQTQMDIESYIDYYCSEIYMANGDWPGNNIIFWRRNVPYNPTAAYGNDGRWRWAIHDMSSTFSDYTENILAAATDPDGPEFPNPAWSTLMFRKLLANPDFKYKFITRFADVLNSTFHPTRVAAKIDELKAEIEPEMPEQIVRWKAPFEIEEWEYFVGERYDFAANRPQFQRNHIRSEFSITNNINVTVNVSNAAHGIVKVNTIEISDATVGIPANPYPWTGIYFSGIPVKLKAIAKPGYMFSHWTGASTATTEEITITSNSAFSCTAVFVPSSFSSEVSVPINFWYMNGAIVNDTPLLNLDSFYEVATNGVIDFQSAFAGYPYTSAHPNWRKASMERRNKPTPINYRPEANGGTPYVAGDMKALQITQPFQDGGLQNTMVFNLSTKDYKNIKFSFAAMDEGAATGITIEYSVNEGAPVWITTGLAATSFALVTNTFQLYESDFTSIATVNDNPNFKIRLRFTGPNMTASAGNRVTFNNIALDGVKLPLIYTSPNVYTVGTAITPLTPTVAASVTSYSVLPVLPAGLSLNTTTGVISGTPTVATSMATYTVTATNAGGTASFGIVITVNTPVPAPTGLSYTSPSVFTKGTAITPLNPTVTGTVTNYSVLPALPAGLSINPTTGVISGTPTVVTSIATYTVTAANGTGSTSFGISITVNDVAPTALSYPTPNVFTKGTAISVLNPTVTGTVTNYSVLPALPAGLSINPTTGVVSGTPTAVTATATYTVTAANSGGNTSFGISITVNDVAPTALSYPTPNIFTKGVAIPTLNPTVTGTVTNYSVLPALPAGLSINPTTGVISGTPSAVTATATYTATAANSGGNTSFGVSITINDVAPTALSYNTPNTFTAGVAISALSPTVTGTVTNYSVLPALPSGLAINPTTGVISGTPTIATATATYTVTAANSGGSTSFGISITVNPGAPSALSYTSPNVFTVDNIITPLSPSVIGTVDSYGVSPALPTGLVLDTTTGVISGTPIAVTSMATYTITATNVSGFTSFGVSITVNDVAPSVLSYNTPNTFSVGTAISALSPSVTGTVTNYSVLPALPAGLSINPTTGVISGTPTAVTATAIYTVTAANSGGNTSFGVSITINDVAPTALSYNTPNTFTAGVAISALSPSVTGTVTNYSVLPALPVGLSINPTTGVISGTPSAVTATAIYTVTAANSGGNTSFGVSITVNDVAPTALSYNTPNTFTVGTAISALSPSVTGTVTNYSVLPALPSGLTINPTTGVISGTPTAVTAAAIYTVTASNSGGNTSFGVSITINDVAPTALSYNTPNTFTVGTAISALSPTVTGTVTNYSVLPALPAGLSINPTTGVISGTPTAMTATATYMVTAQNSGGNTWFGINITINPAAPTALGYTSPNVFTIGSAVLPLLPSVTGTVDTYSVSPALPAGLSINPTTGVISGTPTVVTPMATYTVTATNISGFTSFGVVITVNDIAPTALSYTTPNIYTAGVAISALSPTVTGNVTGYSVFPALPAGLSINPTTGVISGTPTVVTSAQTYDVTASNSGGNVTFGVTITVNPGAPFGLSYPSPNTFTVGSPIAALSPTVSGSVDSYSVIPALPDGLSLNNTTGVISGTPTTVQSSTAYLVTASNAGGSVSFALFITINDDAPTALSYNSPNVYTVGSAISVLNPTVTGTVANYSVLPALPSGLSINPATGVISGTPTTVSATGIYTVTATNSGGNISFGISITVNDVAPTALSYNTPNVFTVGSTISALNPTVTGNVTNYSVLPTLPSGLVLNPVTGVISGTPTSMTATATYTVTASNSGGNTSFGIEITVNDVAPSALAYNTPNVFLLNSAIAALNPTVTGNVASYSVSPSLPSGLVLNLTTGIISGTPTAVTGTAIYTVTATNSGGDVSFGIEITVNENIPADLSYDSPDTYTVGISIAPLVPTITGHVDTFTVFPALPLGLSIDATTGVISGTPTTVTPTAVYTVTATNSGGSTTFDIIITVNDVAPSALAYNTPNVFTVGSAIAALNPTVTGNVTNYSVSPALPAGLTIDANTGIISGTPTAVTAAGSYTVTASNSGGSVSFDVIITVNDAAPSGLSYTTPNIFTVGTAVTLSPTISGGIATLFTVSPALPDGLSLNLITGTISGTPTSMTATATYTITALNLGGNDSFDIVITVIDVAPLALAYSTPNVFTIGSAIVALNPTVTGNVTNYSVVPALPSGLTINATTGIISGTPTAVTANATYTVTATNSGGDVSFGVEISVIDVAPTALAYNTPNVFLVGSAITALNPTVTGNVTNYSVVPALPSGLTINATTGIISGTPTAVTANATYTVTATNSGGDVSFGIEIAVNLAGPSDLSYTTPNVFVIGTVIGSLSPTVTGDELTFTIEPALPLGLAFDPGSGVISGTPGVISAATTYTVTATNSGGSITFDVVISVIDIAPLDFSYPSPNSFTTGISITPLVPIVTGNNISYSVSPDLPSGLTLDPLTGIISGTPTLATATATYTVTATNSGGSVTFEVVITVSNPMGVGENPRFDFGVWPNPFVNTVNLTGVSGELSYKLFAIDGRLIDSGQTNTAQIHFDRLPEGVYLLQLEQDGQSAMKKLIKKD